jgi:hypothetical protein
MESESLRLPKSDKVRGVAFIARAFASAILDDNYVAAVQDVVAGLDLLGLNKLTGQVREALKSQ